MAGSKSGKALSALSLKRAGSNFVQATGAPGKIAGKLSPWAPGESRKGNPYVPNTGQMGVAKNTQTMPFAPTMPNTGRK